MVTVDQIEKTLSDDKDCYSNSGMDHVYTAVSLLRERIPYESCKRIIRAAEHDVIYLCDIDVAADYLTESDILVLADCNCGVENDCIYMFV